MDNNEFRKKVALAASKYCKGIGLTHKQIAERIGLSKSQVDSWFSRGNFSARGIKVLTEEYGVPKEIFITGEYIPIKSASFKDITSRLIDVDLRLTKLERLIEKLLNNEPPL